MTYVVLDTEAGDLRVLLARIEENTGTEEQREAVIRERAEQAERGGE